ncbi:MAG: hypothetical protein ACREQ7_11845 [Candidatus Binatia bacterium]
MARTEQQKRKRVSAGNTASMEELRARSEPRERQQANSGIPTLEWIFGGVGLVLVTSVIGFLLYQALGGNQMPPDVRLRVHSVVQTRNGYLVAIKALNQGGSTAEGLVVEGELRRGAEQVERSHTTIDYLPPGSEKQAGLFFTQDPRRHDLQVRPLGYEEP